MTDEYVTFTQKYELFVDLTSVTVEDSRHVPQTREVTTPRSLQSDTNRSVTDISAEFENARRQLKSDKPTESKPESTETHNNNHRSTSQDDTWDTMRKTGRMSPVLSKGIPSDSLSMTGTRTRASRLR